MIITKNQARFVLAAVCRDVTRKSLTALTAPFVADVAGTRWVCSTDEHRLHAVRCPDQAFALGWCVVSKDGTVASVDREGVRHPPIDNPLIWQPHFDREAIPVSIARLRMVSSGSSGLHVQWDIDPKVPPRVHVDRDSVAESQVTVSAPYVADALLAVPGGKTAPTLVRFARGECLDPVLLCEDRDAPAWRAIIMPLRHPKEPR